MKKAIMRNGLALAVLACATLVAAQERAFAQQGCIEKVPPPPIDVQAVPKTKSVDVAWNAPEPTNACIDSYSYIVYKKNQNRGARSLPSQIREYSLTIKNLEPDTEYTVELTSVNQLKGASKPATVTFRTLKACNLQVKPGAVNPVFLNQNSAKTLLLSWLPPKNGACTDSYQVDGYEVKSNTRVLNSNSVDPKAKVVSLVPGKEYKFLITPQNKRGGGPTTRVTYKMKQKFEVVASGSVPAKGRRMFAA